MREMFKTIARLLHAGEDLALVTVIASSGAAPRGAGARMLVGRQGRICGTIGGGAVEYRSEQIAAQVLEDRTSFQKDFSLTRNDVEDLGMICGGAVEVFFSYIPAGDPETLAIADRAEELFARGLDLWLISEISRGGRLGLYTREEGYVGMEAPAWLEGCFSRQGGRVERDGRDFYLEQINSSGRVYVFGCGHVAQELVPALSHVGFRCVAMDDRPVLSMLAITLSFGFKLQAVFVMPVLAVLWMHGKLRLRHFCIFPVAYVLLVLPAVLLGRPFLDTITLYFNQTGSIGSGLNYNSPSIFGIFWNVQNEAMASKLAIISAFVFMLLVLLVCYVNCKRLTNKAVLAAAVLLAVGIPFLLPHMHDRYFFASDILTVVMAFACWRYSSAAVLAQFASLLGYHAYLKMRYLLPMSYGSWALILVLIIAGTMLFRELGSESGKKIQIAS